MHIHTHVCHTLSENGSVTPSYYLFPLHFLNSLCALSQWPSFSTKFSYPIHFLTPPSHMLCHSSLSVGASYPLHSPSSQSTSLATCTSVFPVHFPPSTILFPLFPCFQHTLFFSRLFNFLFLPFFTLFLP